MLWLNVRDGIVDPATLRVAPGYAPIGWLFGNGYLRTHEEWRATLEHLAGC